MAHSFAHSPALFTGDVWTFQSLRASKAFCPSGPKSQIDAKAGCCREKGRPNVSTPQFAWKLSKPTAASVWNDQLPLSSSLIHTVFQLGNRNLTRVKNRADNEQLSQDGIDAAEEGRLVATPRPRKPAVIESETDLKPAGPMKECLECQRLKMLEDFPRTTTSADGLMDSCRACLAVVRAKRGKKELGHLGITVEEAWERAKMCLRCKHLKEARDFPVHRGNKDGLQKCCRACISLYYSALPLFPPTESPIRCNVCNLLKPALEYSLNNKKHNGRNAMCKTCEIQRLLKEQAQRMATLVYTKREEKMCSTCKQVKPPLDFYKNARHRDGLENTCKICARDYQTALWRMRKVDKG